MYGRTRHLSKRGMAYQYFFASIYKAEDVMPFLIWRRIENRNALSAIRTDREGMNQEL